MICQRGEKLKKDFRSHNERGKQSVTRLRWVISANDCLLLISSYQAERHSNPRNHTEASEVDDVVHLLSRPFYLFALLCTLFRIIFRHYWTQYAANAYQKMVLNYRERLCSRPKIETHRRTSTSKLPTNFKP